MPEHSERQPQRTSGIEFVYDAGLQKIREQLALIDSLDVKMGVLIGFLGALIAGSLAALLAAAPSTLSHLLGWPKSAFLGVAALLVAASLYFAFQAFRMRRYQSGARFQDLYEWANEEAERTMREFLPTLMDAVDFNDLRLKRKQENARLAVLSVFLVVTHFDLAHFSPRQWLSSCHKWNA